MGFDFRAIARNQRSRLTAGAERRAALKSLQHHPPANPSTVRPQVVAFYDDGPVNLYQVRQWLRPLEALDAQLPVALVTQSPASTAALLEETSLAICLLPTAQEVDAAFAMWDPAVVLYVNLRNADFEVMRNARAAHVHLSHGESEKRYMASGQVRAFDFTFVAGPMARRRLAADVPGYDVDQRTYVIGRPQLDYLDGSAPSGFVRRVDGNGRAVVLYAPTWEGINASNRYGSAASHGVAAVQSLVAAGHQVIYRPHPRLGVELAAEADADAAIRAHLAAANGSGTDRSGGHFVDTEAPLDWQFDAADVLLGDNSALTVDWLATGKPMVVTVPATPESAWSPGTFLDDVPNLTVADAQSAGALVTDLLAVDPSADERSRWAVQYFADVSRGWATSAFIDAVRKVIARRNEWLEVADAQS